MINDSKTTLKIAIPRHTALEALEAVEQLDLNMTHAVVVCLKLGIKTYNASHAGNNGDSNNGISKQ